MERTGHNFSEQDPGQLIHSIVSDILHAQDVNNKVIVNCVRYITDTSNRPRFTPDAALGCAKLWETYLSVLDRYDQQTEPEEMRFSLREAVILPLIFHGIAADQPPMTLKQAIIQVTENGRLGIGRMEAYRVFINGLRKLRQRVIED